MSQQYLEPESWVLKKIRAGEPADFQDEFGRLEPSGSEGWDEKRDISAAFLREILSDDKLLRTIPAEGVRIIGARFVEELALTDGHLRRQLWLEQCRFEKPIDLCAQTIDGALSFAGSFVAAPPDDVFGMKLDNTKVDGTLYLSSTTVEGGLSMNGSHVGGDLFIRGEDGEPANFSEMDLSNARIDGQFGFEGVIVKGNLSMNGLCVQEDLFMRLGEKEPAKFAELDLSNAEIKGRIEISGAAEGKLTMNGLHVAKDFFIGSKEQPAKLAVLDLTAAEIDGELRFEDASIKHTLTMNGTRVGWDLIVRASNGKTITFGTVDLGNARIAGQLTIDNATFDGAVTMNGLQVGEDLIIRGSSGQETTFAMVDLADAKIGGQLRFEGLAIAGFLDMKGLKVREHLLMEARKRQLCKFETVDLRGAWVEGDLSLAGSSVEGVLMMKGLHVGRNLHMGSNKGWPSRFAAVDLSNATVDGHFNFNEAKVGGTLNMVDLEVGRDLFMCSSRFSRSKAMRDVNDATVDLSNAEITGRFLLDDAIIDDTFKMNRLQVGQDLSMRGIRCSAENAGVAASLQYLQVDAGLDLHGARCIDLDLAGSTIKGELRLTEMKWLREAHLSLQNAHASVLHDTESAWPDGRELAGFTYDRLGGVGTRRGKNRDMSLRSIDWYIKWLKRDPTYSPQPYEQLAEVLRKAGEPAMARSVLFASRQRAREKARKAWYDAERGIRRRARFRYIGMSLLRWTIGYGLGLRYFWCLLWIGGLTVVGIIVLQSDATLAVWHGLGIGERPSIPDSAVYSLQKLIPFVEFEKFDRVRLGAFAKWYFYIHKVAGYVLALFLGAGFSGLTQKS